MGEVKIERSITFSITDGDVSALVTVTERNGGLVFDVVITSETGTVVDLRALFFNITDETLPSALSVSGGNVTDSQFIANSVSYLGNGANIQGSVVSELGKFDIGVEFGTAGIGEDDVRSTQFVLSHDSSDLTLELIELQDLGVRLTSVGDPERSRDGSLKLAGQAIDVPQGAPCAGFAPKWEQACGTIPTNIKKIARMARHAAAFEWWPASKIDRSTFDLERKRKCWEHWHLRA